MVNDRGLLVSALGAYSLESWVGDRPSGAERRRELPSHTVLIAGCELPLVVRFVGDHLHDDGTPDETAAKAQRELLKHRERVWLVRQFGLPVVCVGCLPVIAASQPPIACMQLVAVFSVRILFFYWRGGVAAHTCVRCMARMVGYGRRRRGVGSFHSLYEAAHGWCPLARFTACSP